MKTGGHLGDDKPFDIIEAGEAIGSFAKIVPSLRNHGVTPDEFQRQLQRTINEDLDPLYSDVWHTVKSME